MNSVEKILANHAGKTNVSPGEIVDASVDLVMTNDATTALTCEIFKEQLKGVKVWDPSRIIMFVDHYLPCNSVDSAEYHKKMRLFAVEQGLANTYEGEGVCHQVMMERHVAPAQLIIGADSHTCTYGALGALATGMGSTDVAVSWTTGRLWFKVPQTIRIELTGRLPAGVYAKDVILMLIGELTARGATYRAMEFTGETVRQMGVSDRATLCNMVVEAGGKFAYIQPDDKTLDYVTARGRRPLCEVRPDADAAYERIVTRDVSGLCPQIACPHGVDNVTAVADVAGQPVDELFIGACTNGRLEDLRVAAGILKDRQVATGVRLLVTPASREVYCKALNEGLIAVFMQAGALVNHPSCSACFGATQGLLGRGERLLSTANRNFRGRVGSAESQIHLASPATVAASAITGRITDPREVM
jgi:3-isopropylmalate/(R)-2-methylmalate dehydratase large subunit